LWEIAHFVTPQETVSASRDETDNRILECAVEAGAEVIVTYDKAREFIEVLGSVLER
jgi:predicted nucleic acid-binding protein